MSLQARVRASRSRSVRSAAVSPVVEGLEQRVMLTVVSNTTPLHTGLDTVVKTATDFVSEIDAFRAKVFGTLDHLPLVGSALKNAEGGVNDALAGLATKIKTELNAIPGLVTGVTVQEAIFAALGPSSPLHILPASITTASQVPITLEDTDGNTANGAEQIDLNLDIQGNLFTATLNPSFDLGLPGLGLKVNGTIQAQVSYDIKLHIAANATDGLYVDLGGSDPEAALTLAVTAPGLTAEGNLGFLRLDATNGTPGTSPTQFTQLVGKITADLGVTGDKLTPATVGSLLSHSTLSADAEADVHLHNVLSFAGNANFPSLQADLDLTWKLASASLDSGGVGDTSFGSEPEVAFNNIKLDIGSFFSKFVSPIVDEVKKIIKPLQPMVDLLNKRMPIFSDIGFLKSKFDTNHDDKVSLLEVMDFFGGGSTKFLDTLVAVDNFVNHIPSGIGADVLLDLGSFDLQSNGADVRGLADLSGVGLSSFTAADLTSAISLLPGGVGSAVSDFLNSMADPVLGGAGGDDGGGLHFPLIEHPTTAFKLFLGQNVDLFTFDTPTLNLNTKLDEFFPILGPLGVELKGILHPDNTFIEVKAHLSMGYDTQGLREWATDNYQLSKAGEVFDGFYIVDDPAKTYASAGIGIGAFASLNLVVASAGVGGGVTGTITFTVNDPDDDGLGADGKLRPKEVLSDLKMSPLCIFNIAGKIDASLNAFVQVGFDTPFGFVGYRHTFDLGSTNLVDFSVGCSVMHTDPPVLATLLGDATLRLNVGPYAYARVSGDITDDGESYIVTHLSTEADGTETVNVNAFGYDQVYSGVARIYGEGGIGDDSIILTPGVLAPSELWGDFNPGNADNGGASANGNDSLTAADGTTVMHGGDGNDQLKAGNGAATVLGDGGDDLIFGSPSADLLDGGDGNDAIYGMAGNDNMFGGAGDDNLDGSDGNDAIDGGAGNDHLIGGIGNDALVAGAGNDVLEGNAGDDAMDGGVGNDLLLGDDSTIVYTGTSYDIVLSPGGGNDVLNGGDGNDSMYGQGGNDAMSGDKGDDYMQGNADNDKMDGGDGADSVIGGQGADSVTGGFGNDILLGDDGDVSSGGTVTLADSVTDGNDTMGGGDGNDAMYGQGGDDVMTGDAGNDFMSGGAVNDNMSGGDGNDMMTGGDGNDLMAGNAGDDSMAGDAGNDNISGGDGNDTQSGGDGSDVMTGDAGNDSMAGNAGNDAMSGGDGSDWMIGGQGDDAMSGDGGNDIMLGDDGSITPSVTLANSPTDGNDAISGGTGNDLLFGQGGNDVMTGDDGNDQMVGGLGNDLMDGGADNDLMLGDGATIGAGNSVTPISSATDGNDTMRGSAGADVMYGQGGDDDMIGGQGNDLMLGGDGQDVMLGDDGSVVPASPAQLQPDTSSVLRVALPASLSAGGDDVMDGGNGNDVMFGQGGNDAMHGSAGDDYMEGNAGADNMAGDVGDDDMIGGSSVAVTADGADVMDGGSGNDVMLGDNGKITRRVDGSNNYVHYNAINKLGLQDGAITRNVTLFADQDSIGGNDTMSGGTGDDIMYGEAANDLMAGNEGNDQMIGGGGNDIMDGGTGNDCMLGDKGIINPSIFDGSTQHTIKSQDHKVSKEVNVVGTINWLVTLIDPSFGGNDVMNGGLGNDAMHGGAGADTMKGDDPSSNSVGGDDAIYGDVGNDSVSGQAGNDDVFGGTGDDWLDGGVGNDIIYGGDGQDVLIADNKDDRLIDWFGNFNQFIVPGPGFGAPTIIRSPAPQMRDFLLDLGAADGATDPQLELYVVAPPSPSNSGPGGRN